MLFGGTGQSMGLVRSGTYGVWRRPFGSTTALLDPDDIDYFNKLVLDELGPAMATSICGHYTRSS
jgi:hypothetical protein